MSVIISTHVQGIPCQVKVTYHTPYRPARTYGPPEHCYPEEPGDLDFDVLDRRGRPAPWLERKLTPDDEERIGAELLEAIEEERHAY